MLKNYYSNCFQNVGIITEIILVYFHSLEVHFEGTFADKYLIVLLMCTQSAFTCLKLTIETLEQSVKYVQS